jgi:hypothetical protein
LPDSETTSERNLKPISLEGKPSKIGTKLYFLSTMKKTFFFSEWRSITSGKRKRRKQRGNIRL